MTTTSRINRSEEIRDAVRSVLPSGEPAIVFISLASLCVPTFSDRCQILIEEAGLDGYQIRRPSTGDDLQTVTGDAAVLDVWSGQWIGEHTVRTLFAGAPTWGHPGYRATVTYAWDADYDPTGTDVALAQVAVEHAGAIVRRERGFTNRASSA